jgi:hypothetical protein
MTARQSARPPGHRLRGARVPGAVGDEQDEQRCHGRERRRDGGREPEQWLKVFVDGNQVKDTLATGNSRDSPISAAHRPLRKARKVRSSARNRPRTDQVEGDHGRPGRKHLHANVAAHPQDQQLRVQLGLYRVAQYPMRRPFTQHPHDIREGTAVGAIAAIRTITSLRRASLARQRRPGKLGIGSAHNDEAVLRIVDQPAARIRRSEL